MYFKSLLPLTLLLTLVSGTKIDFNTDNQPIIDDPTYGIKIGNVDEYVNKLNKTEKESEMVGMSRSFVRNTRVGSIQQSYYNALVAGTSYCSDQQLNNWNCRHCRMLGNNLKLHTIINEPLYKTRAIVYLDDNQKRIVLAFRGSANLNNWAENLKFDRTSFPIVPGGEVHRGFKNMADKLQFKYNPVIADLRKQPKYENYDVVVTGHSLGGALSILASIYLQQEQANLPWSKIYTYTYNQPRIGNMDFALWYNSLDTTTTRVVNSRDAVPHMPPMFAKYRHLFTEVLAVGSNSYVCGTDYIEDPNCSNRYVPFLGISYHNSVWDIELGIDGC